LPTVTVKAVIDLNVLALDIAGFFQGLTERPHRRIAWRTTAEEADDWHRRLLRPRGKRPSYGRSTEPGDEFAPSKANAHLPVAHGGAIGAGYHAPSL
jgi:hypothetical protein